MAYSSHSPSTAPEVAHPQHSPEAMLLSDNNKVPPTYYNPQSAYPPTHSHDAYHPTHRTEVVFPEKAKQQRKICALRPVTFFLTVALIIVIVIAAAVGGGVGGWKAAQRKDSSTNTTMTAKDFVAQHSGTLPLDCPSLDGRQISRAAYYSSSTTYAFKLSCNTDFTNPTAPDGLIIKTYTLEDCLDACVSLNERVTGGAGSKGCTALEWLANITVVDPLGNCFLNNFTEKTVGKFSMHDQADGRISAILA